MAEIAIELKDLTKRFDDVMAVDNINLHIYDNEFFSLLGPSGCGKTTTLRMIGGFEYPTSGEILIKGHRVNDVPAHRRDTNLVFQQLALFPHLDVFDNIAFGLRMKGVARSEIRDRVKAVLELVELPELGERRIQQLSGGQQQRVAIARALINEPSVLLLDEPLGALDLKLRLQMQIELKELQHRVGTTFIYVTHDQGEALTMSDRVAVMRHGRIEQLGTVEEVYERPHTRFVASFIGDSNLLEGEVTGLDSERALVQCNGIGIAVLPIDDLRIGEKATISLRPERIAVEGDLSQFENRFGGRVLHVTYQGSLIKYEVELPSGDKIIVDAQPGAERAVLHPGDEVEVGWTAACCVLVEDE
jgi:spermidine/putrescine transport system ATP-binding protein